MSVLRVWYECSMAIRTPWGTDKNVSVSLIAHIQTKTRLGMQVTPTSETSEFSETGKPSKTSEHSGNIQGVSEKSVFLRNLHPITV